MHTRYEVKDKQNMASRLVVFLGKIDYNPETLCHFARIELRCLNRQMDTDWLLYQLVHPGIVFPTFDLAFSELAQLILVYTLMLLT